MPSQKTAPQSKLPCPCCGQYLTRAREKEHRAAFAALQDTPSAPNSSTRVRSIDEFLRDDDNVVVEQPTNRQRLDTPHLDFPDIELEHDAQRHMHASPESPHTPVTDEAQADNDDADFENSATPEPDSSDGEDDGEGIDWAAFEKYFEEMDGLIGEDYERFAAEIGEKLTEYDLAICRAFAYKVFSHTTDDDFAKIPQAFPQNPPLPKLDSIRSRVSFLSGFKPEIYDCCPNSCCCFVGPNHDLNECPHCGETRYRQNRKARKHFVYIPLIPRLVAFFSNHDMAKEMRYRSEHVHTPGMTRDVFDGTLYQTLRNLKIKIDDETLNDKYFSDHRDIALGLSTDGFCPWRKRKSTAWPLLVFNYNLPPEVRFHLCNILALGVIPGPKKPHDPDSFLWPFVNELHKLMEGIYAFDILESVKFKLRAFLILVFGDMPAVSMLMHMKGHNGISPCRMCEIRGLRVPQSTATTHYVPLYRSNHPTVLASPQSHISHYDAGNLPLRTHDQFLQQAKSVHAAPTKAEAERQSKLHGIKGMSILSRVSSLRFPQSFPHDFMHLMFENTIKNLTLHWSGGFKDLDAGKEDYIFSKDVWEAIGVASATSGSTIPSAYGSRVPDIVADRSNCSAEMWSFWALYIGPVLLRRRFRKRAYLHHYLLLVQLIQKCLQFEIVDTDVEEIRTGFIKWVTEYEKLYYQHDPYRIAACPVTIHALLHIADDIKAAGPVWCYWAFPMERYCGKLQPAIRSRRFPFASLDRFVLEEAQLKQITISNNLGKQLQLLPPITRPVGFRSPLYPSCILLPPSSKRPPDNLIAQLCSALRTRAQVDASGPPERHTRPGTQSRASRDMLPMDRVRACLQKATIIEWGKVKRVDSDAGDTMRTVGLGTLTEDARDASFVRYEMFVDINASYPRRPMKFELRTFYGQLEHIFVIEIEDQTARQELRLPPEQRTLIFAAIRTCLLDKDTQLENLDIHFYSKTGQLDVVDITSVQCLVGRIKDKEPRTWAIIDRSGGLARAVAVDEET